MSSGQQSLPSPPPQNNGKLIATILSAYDLPSNDAQPQRVILETLNQTLETGPPSARHKERNSFKFIDDTKGKNELVVSAPLSKLYNATIKFTVVIDEEDETEPNFEATCKISSVVRVNEMQWLILNLTPSTGSIETGTGAADPTLRLKLELKGPYRPEIAAIITASRAWFHTVDNLSDTFGSVTTKLTTELPSKFPAAKLLLVPAVPLTSLILVSSPVLLGIMIVGLPFFLPLLVIVSVVAMSLSGVISGLYFSTKGGRAKVGSLLHPAYSTFVSTPAGQRFVYETGPRPSPKSIAELILPKDMTGKLLTSLLIDFIGSSSYLLPLVGETFDISWAPIQTVAISAMYDETMPSLKYISFMEEILPFTDIVPSATMGWVKQYSPLLMDQGRKKMHDLGVVMRREGVAVDGLRRH